MRGDFSRLFEHDPNIACVLQKQGQILRDSDLNQQAVHVWNQLKQLITDISHALQNPANNRFVIKPITLGPAGELILPDVIYADGIRVGLDDKGKTRTLTTKDLRQYWDGTYVGAEPPKDFTGKYSLFLELRE